MPKRIGFHKPRALPERRLVESKSERNKFYSGTAWRRCRSAYLDANPLCVDCRAIGLDVEATIPHHLEERLARPDLAYDWDNLIPLCSPCHTSRHKATPGGESNPQDPTPPSRALSARVFVQNFPDIW
jgi:5-methylcytosine-specific restriction enzyme A